MESFESVLVVEAHSDDSAIAAAGLLGKIRSSSTLNFILMSASDVNFHHVGRVDREARLIEYQDYLSAMGGHWRRDLLEPLDYESRLDTLPRRQIVGMIESAISEVRPDLLIVQGPSFHHDHTTVYESVIAATRPTARHLPSTILIMENPTYVHSIGPATDFKPDTYCVLTRQQLEEKITTFTRCFPTQVRAEGNYLSPEGIELWSRYRGLECRADYAEAFRTFIKIY